MKTIREELEDGTRAQNSVITEGDVGRVIGFGKIESQHVGCTVALITDDCGTWFQMYNPPTPWFRLVCKNCGFRHPIDTLVPAHNKCCSSPSLRVHKQPACDACSGPDGEAK